MRPLIQIFTGLAVCLYALAGICIADETTFDASGWVWRARIEPEREAEEGLVEFSVIPEVFDRARPGLSDLRVLAGARALPWVKFRQAGTQRDVPVEVKLYNPTRIPGEQNRVTADFGDRLIKNRIRVQTPGRDFKRRVRVEASQDALSWQILVEDAFLFDVAGLRHSDVSLPPNDFRYLRVTVYHDPDDPEDVPIEDITAWRREGQPPLLEPVSIAATSMEHDKDQNISIISLDTGYRNLPLRSLSLDFEDENFHRYLTLWGRNEETRTVVRQLEGGGAREMIVEEPWQRITAGHIHRYAAGGAYSASLNIEAGPFRYLQARIHDGDNPPLTFRGAEAERYVIKVVFPPSQPGPYRLYFGNPAADMPDYDLAHYVRRLRSEGVTAAEIGAVAALHPEEPEAERHDRWVLWIAMLASVAAVLWMVWRQALNTRSMRP